MSCKCHLLIISDIHSSSPFSLFLVALVQALIITYRKRGEESYRNNVSRDCPLSIHPPECCRSDDLPNAKLVMSLSCLRSSLNPWVWHVRLYIMWLPFGHSTSNTPLTSYLENLAVLSPKHTMLFLTFMPLPGIPFSMPPLSLSNLIVQLIRALLADKLANIS